MKIRARAPLRLGFAGGGTDVSPYCDTYGGCITNATIDRYAYTTLEELTNGREFLSLDQGKRHVADSRGGSGDLLLLHQGVYVDVISRFNDGKPLNVRVSTLCEAPAGSGLGGSSTIVVSMLKAYDEYLGLGLSAHELATMAYKIERDDIQLAGGRQDQFSAAYGGINFMEFGAGIDVKVTPVAVSQSVVNELQASLLVIYTGQSRESANIIEDQQQRVKTGTSLEATHALKQEAIRMRDCLTSGDFAGIIETMRVGWENKKKLSQAVSNTTVDIIYEAAMKAGAQAGRVSGAGGGGFMMFFVPPEKRIQVINTLSYFNSTTNQIHLTPGGAISWKL